MFCAGIDAGSRTIKVVLLDAKSLVVAAKGCVPQGIDHDALATKLFNQLLQFRGLRRADVKHIVATGYTRNGIRLADETVTEITCHARGVRHVAPQARMVVEIGGQDSKLLWLAETGGVQDFAMNDRCAAGTGRFLEIVAARLEVGLDSLETLARLSQKPAAISSMCVVFAETEIIGLLSSGVPAADIVAGVRAAIAARVVSMAGLKIMPPVVFTGGVALIPGMAAALSAAIGQSVAIAPDPQMTGALGAALLAAQKMG
jgi:predicted CoA-substrate-specific enzyme activase